MYGSRVGCMGVGRGKWEYGWVLRGMFLCRGYGGMYGSRVGCKGVGWNVWE